MRTLSPPSPMLPTVRRSTPRRNGCQGRSVTSPAPRELPPRRRRRRAGRRQPRALADWREAGSRPVRGAARRGERGRPGGPVSRGGYGRRPGVDRPSARGHLKQEAVELARPPKFNLTPVTYADRLNQNTAVIAKLNGLRQSDPASAAKALAAAHTKLVAAVNDPSRNYAALLTAVSDFATQAKAVHAALTAPAT